LQIECWARFGGKTGVLPVIQESRGPKKGEEELKGKDAKRREAAPA
jgi:hypothetical protein